MIVKAGLLQVVFRDRTQERLAKLTKNRNFGNFCSGSRMRNNSPERSPGVSKLRAASWKTLERSHAGKMLQNRDRCGRKKSTLDLADHYPASENDSMDPQSNEGPYSENDLLRNLAVKGGTRRAGV